MVYNICCNDFNLVSTVVQGFFKYGPLCSIMYNLTCGKRKKLFSSFELVFGIPRTSENSSFSAMGGCRPGRSDLELNINSAYLSLAINDQGSRSKFNFWILFYQNLQIFIVDWGFLLISHGFLNWNLCLAKSIN